MPFGLPGRSELLRPARAPRSIIFFSLPRTNTPASSYLGREALEVSVVARGELFARLDEEPPPGPLYILVAGEPLPSRALDPKRLELVGEFRNWPDLQRHGRRWLYRLRR